MEEYFDQATLNNDSSSKILISCLRDLKSSLDFSDSYLYYKFPIGLDDAANVKKTNVLFISRKYGIFLFNCLDETERTLNTEILSATEEELEEIYTAIYSKLIKSKSLRLSPTSLRVSITPIIFFTNLQLSESKYTSKWRELLFVTKDTLKNEIFRQSNDLSREELNEILASIEGSKALAKKTDRPISTDSPLTKGKIIAIIEDEIAIFDNEQRRAGFHIINGPQRIRGLAGSGKTVILAMKAAQIHLNQPDARILFTYWTKNLYDFVKKLITRFYRIYAEVDPDWDKIHIMHAWGGRNLNGVYYKTCIENNIVPRNWKEAQIYGKEAFNEVCKPLANEKLKVTYDYAILDEAQDFPTYFYQICRKITKNNQVIWAYDECQNILNMELQNTVETFGKDESGKPYIDFNNRLIEDQDLILHKCYRNPRKILISAFALGMGIYSNIVQLPENKELWEDWGFEVVSGNYHTNDEMIITRPEANSPLLKNRLLDDTESIIGFKDFSSLDQECEYVAGQIITDINQNLRPEDILVISLDDRDAKKYFSTISNILEQKGIHSFNLLDAPGFNTRFSLEDHITLSTVYRAKGNEAPQVYIVGIDCVFEYKNSPESRNKIFTAMTRAKGWVHITGLGTHAQNFCNEIQKVINNDFELRFIMPDMKKLKVFQRDLEIEQVFKNKFNRLIDEIVLETGLSREIIQQQLKIKLSTDGVQNEKQ